MSRIEKILQAIIDGISYSEEPQSRIEEILLAIKNNTQYSDLPQSRIEEILLAIKNNDSYDNILMSRIEEILFAKLKGLEYTKLPQSRIEELLIKWIKQEIELEGVPPLTYKTIKGTLTNYRIYGNTVDGESVGDRTRNLFDGQLIDGYYTDNTLSSIAGAFGIYQSCKISLPAGTYTIVFTEAVRMVRYIELEGTYLSNPEGNKDVASYTFTLHDNNTVSLAFRNASNTMWDGTIKIQIVEGSESLPYEPYGYRVPVAINDYTVTLYLPEQIKKFGDETEYVDFVKQKQHRVRKNLLLITAKTQTVSGVTFTVNNDGSVTCNGTATALIQFPINTLALFVITENVILSGCPRTGSVDTFLLRAIYPQSLVSKHDTGNGALIKKEDGDSVRVQIRIASGYTCDNLTFYPMIRKANVGDDSYEPYIEDTYLDVTLPTLPTIEGTNVLTVETEVKPSKVYVKYKGG